ncbi:MAG: PASTA domain-containing protein [Bacteroidia bacterium]
MKMKIYRFGSDISTIGTEHNKFAFHKNSIHNKNLFFARLQQIWQKHLMNTFISFLKSRVFLFNLFTAIAIVLLLMAFVFKWLDTYTRHGESITVPDLRGRKIVELTSPSVQYSSFNYRIADSSIYQADLPKGTIIQQDPKPGEKVKEGRTIYVTITRTTAPEIKMPDLIDVSYRQAEAILVSYGLKVGEIIYRPDLAKNAVLAMQINNYVIRPGDMVSKGTTIDLVLGDGYGNTQVPVPELYNLTLTEALFVLKGSALNAGRIEYDGTVLDSTLAHVYKQNPASGDSVFISQGQIIDLYLTQSDAVLDQHNKNK